MNCKQIIAVSAVILFALCLVPAVDAADIVDTPDGTVEVDNMNGGGFDFTIESDNSFELTVTVSENGKIGITMYNGMSLPIQRLSSGEKQILIMFFALLFHADAGSVVILDEPEISLHVSWQQKLGRYYSDICRVRGIQMIVATHSPQVIHDMWDSARELRHVDA